MISLTVVVLQFANAVIPIAAVQEICRPVATAKLPKQTMFSTNLKNSVFFIVYKMFFF